MKKMNLKNQKKDIDKITGIETTGREWDGLKELNNPLPKWWATIFFISCIWALIYWVIYPSWPIIFGEGERGGTIGVIEWTQYNKLEEDIKKIKEIKKEYMEEFRESSYEEIFENEKIYAFSVAGGESSFKNYCATCHGIGGGGKMSYPNLNDDDWIWGGSLEEIEKTIKYGIRADHEESSSSEMPSFRDAFTEEQIEELARYILIINDNESDTIPIAELFRESCGMCHSDDGSGNKEVGGPNIVDNIWLHSSGDMNGITNQIKQPKHGIMPAWIERLDEDTIRQLTVYVYSLGGGE